MRIIAGPCQHESLEQSLEIAKECQRVCDLYDIEYYFKASYDKLIAPVCLESVVEASAKHCLTSKRLKQLVLKY